MIYTEEELRNILVPMINTATANLTLGHENSLVNAIVELIKQDREAHALNIDAVIQDLKNLRANMEKDLIRLKLTSTPK